MDIRQPLSRSELTALDAYWRAANYLSVGQIYLVGDVIDRVAGLGPRMAYVKQILRDRLLEHKEYIVRHGDDMPDIRDWTWE
jgi:phosphoketolase